MRKIIKVCVYCGNEVGDDYCHQCHEYDGIVEGYYDSNNEFVEVER